MKRKNFFITLAALFFVILSCKKENNSTLSKDMNVRYEVTWTGSLDTRYSSAGINQLGYLNSTGNNQFDNLPIASSSYAKTVTIASSAHVSIIAAGAMIALQQPGSGEIKVYVNDKLVADQTANTTNSSDIQMLVLNVHWSVK